MRKVTVEAVVYTVNSGIVGLSADQARTRLHCLRAIKAGKDGAGEYEVLKPVQFKRGESFAYSGEVGKTGQLNDPEAEAIAQLELEDRLRAELRKVLEPQIRAEVEGRVRADYEKQLAELRAQLEAATARKVG